MRYATYDKIPCSWIIHLSNQSGESEMALKANIYSDKKKQVKTSGKETTAYKETAMTK